MAIGKKTRFEIFKRDVFACQYCGRIPPSVILEVDHVHPVSKGGTDDPLNLTTSCFDCNRGKSSNELSIKMPDRELVLIQEKERSEQTKQLNKFILKRRKDAEKNNGKNRFVLV